jgi:cell division transport system permease protein
MFSISFKRIIKSGWLDFKRNSGLSLATVFILVMTISLVTALFLSRHTFDFMIDSFSEKVDMAVYFNEDPSADDVMNIQRELSALPEVKNLQYISKEEALQKFVDRHGSEQVIMQSLEEVGGNPLLPSLTIKAWETTQYAAISEFLGTASFKNLISKVDYSEKKPAIDKLYSLTSSISISGWFLSAVLALVAVLLAFNTVRMAIYNAKDEIQTMKLVGASDWFIRGPFLVQGVAAGALAVLISFVIFGVALIFVSPELDIIVPGLHLSSYFFTHFWLVLLVQLTAGVGLGACASLLAIRKYLKI